MPRLPRRLTYGEEATLVEHLGELRARIVISLLALLVTTTVAYIFRGHLLTWLNEPLPADKRQPVTFGIAEPFITSLKVSLYAGFLVALPVILWQVWAFLAPAMQVGTQRVIAGFSVFAAVLLAAGIAFGYFVALPAAVHFLTNFDKEHYTILIRASAYYSFASLVLLVMGLVFELPIFILGLVRLRILTAASLRRGWRWGIVAMVALAVALPGVDPVTTTIEAVPLLVLYFLSVALATVFERRWAPESDPFTSVTDP
jgi:sec-independent protein translocase protein TatC